MDWHLQCGTLKHLLLLIYAFEQGQIKRLFFLTFLNVVYFFIIFLHKDKFIDLVTECTSLKEEDDKTLCHPQTPWEWPSPNQDWTFN